MHISHIAGLLGMTVLFGANIANADPLPPMEERTNLALNKKVLFSPTPNYSLTARGDTDTTDLTDGKITARPDQNIWRESLAVGWSYSGRVNMALDLGKQCDIDEVAIRFLNGNSNGSARNFPGWVEAFVSNDGKRYTKVAEFSQWNKGEFQKFGIEENAGSSWVSALRFKGLNTQGRWVGLRFYGNGLSASDELYVFGSPASGVSAQHSDAITGFTVTQPQIYFNKPDLQVATNVDLPVPIGMTVADSTAPVTFNLEVPKGFDITAGNMGDVKISDLTPKVLSESWTRYSFTIDKPDTNKVFGRLYVQASGWQNGQKGELRYQFGNADWQSPQLAIPVHAITMPAAPRLKNIMASMGWWSSASVEWPNQTNAFRQIGLNTFNVFGMWMTQDEQTEMLEKARQEGFHISNIDSPMHQITKHHKDAKEIYDQFADGTVGKKLCVSYRGQFYQEEIQRFASMMAKVRPDFSSEDIELWSWTGPVDSKECTRCQASFKASGLADWDDWQKAQGKEIIGDLTNAAQKAVKVAGGKPFLNGGYNFRPGKAYQNVYDFDQLYPQLMQSSQPSTYSSLQPADITLIGDRAREDRQQMPRSDVMPWISPGDAGVFPGDSFQWALLECYANGSRGIWFWSSRVWDSEGLIAYNKVIRAIAPVEDVITKGDLVGSSAIIDGEGRVSGMKLGNRMMLLAADYFGKSNDSLTLILTLLAKSELRDLVTGETVGKVLSAGKQNVTIPLNGQRARLLEVVPQ